MKDRLDVGQNPTITVKRAPELSETDRTAWETLRASNTATYSPYFHLDYIKASALRVLSARL